MSGPLRGLLDLQRRFGRYVLNGVDAISELVDASAQADAQTRVEVYSQAYRLRLLEVLGNDFPGLRFLLGAEGFEALGRAYIEAHPSPHYNVRWYGDRLSGFMRTNAPWLDQAAWAEMAELEWAMTLVFDASDESLAGVDHAARLAPADWPGMTLELQGALRRLPIGWNVQDIRRSVDREETVPSLHALDSALECVVWRKDRTVRYRLLGVDEAEALRAFSDGASFSEVCELLCQWHEPDAVAMRAASLLKQWLDDQWVRSLDVAT